MTDEAKTNILLVDDRPENLLALEAVLGELGQNLITASSGAEALKWVLLEDFAVILLDVQMPGMSGLETAQLIKQRDKSRHIPIIFITAIDQDAPHVFQGYSVGAVDYLFKPFDPEILRSKVAVFVDLARKNMRIQQQAAELEIANRQLKESERHKDEFLSVISHELRTPLNLIMGFGEMLDDEVAGSLNAQQHEYMREILQGANRLQMLVNDLMDVAAMQAGTLELHPVPTPYEGVVDEVVSTFEPVARQKGLTLTTELEPPLLIEIDGPRLVHVLSNLVSNAIKFTPEGGAIRIKVYRHEQDLVTEVCDTGIGLAEEDIPLLFTRFRQLDMSTTRPAGGTGLGLSIAKMLVESHGGTITAMSPGKGRGSVFSYTLPIVKREPCDADQGEQLSLEGQERG